MSDEQHYIRVRGRVQGPFTADQLHAMARRGQFSRLHEVSADGHTWSRAADHAELFPAPVASDIGSALKMSAGNGQRHAAPATAAIAPDEFLLTPAEEARPEWYYARSGEQTGPITFESLRALLATGQLGPGELVWKAGMPGWVAAGEVAELSAGPPAWPARATPVAAPVGARDRETRTSGMAVAALVLGMLAAGLATLATLLVFTVIFFVAGGIAALFTAGLAVIFGHSALKEMRRDPERITGRGLAVTGLVFGYLVLAVAAFMALLMLGILALTIVGLRAAAP